MAAPESLLQGWLGGRFASLAAATIAHPLVVPYDQLAGIDGWLFVVPTDDETPAVETIPWLSAGVDEPNMRIASAMLIAADYAIRRGAHDESSVGALLARECPVAIISVGALGQDSAALLDLAMAAGVPVIREATVEPDSLRTRVPSFGLRATAHAADIARRHDPVFTFQSVLAEESIGGNSFSSYLVHNAGERDQVVISGTMSSNLGIEIGLGGDGITVERTAEIERLAAAIPSFLEGVQSTIEVQSLRIGWRTGDAPGANDIGEVLRVWLKGLTESRVVDVRLVFGPTTGPSPELAKMRARAAAYRRARAAEIAGRPIPPATAHRNPLDGGD